MASEPPTYYYVEHDGMVYLVERGGRLSFPTRAEVPFDVDVRVETRYGEALVRFCVPRLDAWPRDWIPKDDVPGLHNVDPLVQRAINASLVREVSGALILPPDGSGSSILMVKAARGFTKGMWNMPGGFVVYGETPEESIVREVKEETGLDIAVSGLLGVYSARFRSPYFMRGHVFLTKALHADLALSPDEIAEARWMPFGEAYGSTLNPFCRSAIERHLGHEPG